MTVQIRDAAASYTYAGTEMFVPVVDGYPIVGLAALYQLDEGTGTILADTLGGTDGAIAHPVATNNDYNWLPELQLQGTEIGEFPAISVVDPWSMAYIFEVTGSVPPDAVTERITALTGFRDFTTLPSGVRGVLLYLRGGVSSDWNDGPVDGMVFYARAGDGSGGAGAGVALAPFDHLVILDQRLLAVVSYDGGTEVTATIYRMDGSVMCATSLTVTEAMLTTGTGGNVDTTLQPIIGGPSGTYSGGEQTAYGFAIYDHVIGSAEVDALLVKANSL